jgi:hypothetical protein
MNMWTLWAAPALALPALLATEGWISGAQQPRRGLVRVENEDAERGFDAERWRAALLANDLDQRERSFEELVALARVNPDARRALDDWSQSDDRTLAWTARLARREVGARAGLLRRDGPFGGFETQFGDLHERLRELESLFEDFGRGHGLWTPHLDPTTPPGATLEQKQSYRIEIGPDGARVQVTEKENGEETVKEYEADSLDELLEANPELRQRFDVRIGGRSLPTDGLLDLRKLWRPDSQPRMDILGIEYQPPPPETVESLELEPGVGLFVLRTVPGTIAHVLGIKRGDVLIELNKNKLLSGDDVTRVLRERAPEAEVVVKLVDAKGQERTLTWKPSERGEER